MPFYSHSKTLPDGRIIGVKTIERHSANVCKNARLALEKGVCFSIPFNETQLLLKDLGLYHDLGKFTWYFQRYLLTEEAVDRDLRSHARVGAYAIFVKYLHKDPVVAMLSFFVILHHHNDLKHIRDNEFEDDLKVRCYQDRFHRQKETLKDSMDIIRKELQDEQLGEYLYYPDSKFFGQTVKKIIQHPDIQYYFLLNYLFSLLIEADKLDASETPFYSLMPLDAGLVDQYRPLGISMVSKFPDMRNATQNQLRSYCRWQASQYLLREDWHCHRLFTLTAPTGIGKTLIALDFALKLRTQLREKEQREARIIYALPFINIIEQAYKVYSEVFEGVNMRLLAHYQYADALEQTSLDEDNGYKQKAMLLDTWQCDVVITTFVQFFQTLIGNRNKLLKKFNHYAGSIIILDEVQTIRLGQLPLIGAALYYLSKFLNARIVLMTATKPKIFDLANERILAAEGEKAHSIELLPDHVSVFSCFTRTRIVPLLGQPLKDEREFLENIFFNKWKPDRSCLIVCNTVRRSLDLYEALVSAVDVRVNPVYYLSTNIIPLHRQKVIDEIGRDMSAGNKPILVATQCIEAGVDLDFDMGFRDLGPIDSIIQVAGRINRNNHPGKRYSPLYIIDFGDCTRIYDAVTSEQSKKALADTPEIPEEAYLELVENYFSQTAMNKSFRESSKIFTAMKELKYTPADKTDTAVSSFRIIKEELPTLSVFIELDEHAGRIKDNFIQLIHKKISTEDFAPYKRAFQQHIIAVPANLPQAKELTSGSGNYLLCEGLYMVSNERVKEFYNEITGFQRAGENKEHSMFF